MLRSHNLHFTDDSRSLCVTSCFTYLLVKKDVDDWVRECGHFGAHDRRSGYDARHELIPSMSRNKCDSQDCVWCPRGQERDGHDQDETNQAEVLSMVMLLMLQERHCIIRQKGDAVDLACSDSPPSGKTVTVGEVYCNNYTL